MDLLPLAVAASSLTLSLFGNVAEKLQQQTPWYDFQDEGAVLWTVRAEKIPQEKCSQWEKALENYFPEGWAPLQTTPSGLAPLSDWGTKDPTILECQEFPCGVKLNEKEVARLAPLPASEKIRMFDQILFERIRAYPHSRPPYEFSQPPMDPWKLFEQHIQWIAPISPPQESQLGTRQLMLNTKEFQSIRQVLDRRWVKNPIQAQQTLWIRDVYTDHYFESWGEWMHLSCASSQKSNEPPFWIHIVVLELDLLKKTDFFSRIMRGKLKSAVKQETTRYLERTLERLKGGTSSHAL